MLRELATDPKPNLLIFEHFLNISKNDNHRKRGNLAKIWLILPLYMSCIVAMKYDAVTREDESSSTVRNPVGTVVDEWYFFKAALESAVE